MSDYTYVHEVCWTDYNCVEEMRHCVKADSDRKPGEIVIITDGEMMQFARVKVEPVEPGWGHRINVEPISQIIDFHDLLQENKLEETQ